MSLFLSAAAAVEAAAAAMMSTIQRSLGGSYTPDPLPLSALPCQVGVELELKLELELALSPNPIPLKDAPHGSVFLSLDLALQRLLELEFGYSNAFGSGQLTQHCSAVSRLIQRFV